MNDASKRIKTLELKNPVFFAEEIMDLKQIYYDTNIMADELNFDLELNNKEQRIKSTLIDEIDELFLTKIDKKCRRRFYESLTDSVYRTQSSTSHKWKIGHLAYRYAEQYGRFDNLSKPYKPKSIDKNASVESLNFLKKYIMEFRV